MYGENNIIEIKVTVGTIVHFFREEGYRENFLERGTRTLAYDVEF